MFEFCIGLGESARFVMIYEVERGSEEEDPCSRVSFLLLISI